MSDRWRPPTSMELGILERMLQADFPAVEVLRKQLPGLQVREIDNESSLELKVESQVRALLKLKVPVEARYSDGEPYEVTNQVHVHFLLHVAGGLMNELEIYKDDGTQILRPPEISELHVFTPDNWDTQ
jgi:hypothetical protein